jgi:phosphoribosylglycinamide formyltransferase-1
MGKRMAIFASGGGSNARRLMLNGCRSNHYEVVLVLTDRRKSGVQLHAQEFSVPVEVVHWNSISSSSLLEILTSYKVDFIVLAGFLRLIPTMIIDKFHQRIINLHPSLLPKFGGRGMYGRNVHEAVFRAQETQTGITIHYVSEQYDKGAIIAQFTVDISSSDGVNSIESKVRSLESQHFVNTVEDVCKNTR